MRLAVISDIHGNIWALEAALEDLGEQGADLVVNGGDIPSGPLEPASTADLLMDLALPTIAGNHERQLLACERQRGGASDQHAFEHTTARQRNWLAGLPGTLELPDSVLLCHGTPTSDRDYFLEEVEGTRVRLAAQSAMEAHATAVERSLILCGHSHVPRVCSLSRGRLVVNPGSVGLQAYGDDHPSPHTIENGSPALRYAICEQRNGRWRVWQRCVEYDHTAAAATARRNGRPDWAHWLETGRV